VHGFLSVCATVWRVDGISSTPVRTVTETPPVPDALPLTGKSGNVTELCC